MIRKKDGSYCPVYNLRPLNRFIKKLHFKMEGMATVKELVQWEDWFCTINLKDANLSVAVNKEHGGTSDLCGQERPFSLHVSRSDSAVLREYL